MAFCNIESFSCIRKYGDDDDINYFVDLALSTDIHLIDVSFICFLFLFYFFDFALPTEIKITNEPLNAIVPQSADFWIAKNREAEEAAREEMEQLQCNIFFFKLI